jgi:hypothetical protein
MVRDKRPPFSRGGGLRPFGGAVIAESLGGGQER